MFAAATLVDARTGAVILAHPDLEAFVLGGGGLIRTAVQAAIDSSRNETPEGKLIANFGRTYRGVADPMARRRGRQSSPGVHRACGKRLTAARETRV